MVDYKKDTGSTGQMMIRDTGTWVEFWIKASSYTYTSRMPWGYKVNGTTDTSNFFDFKATGSWQRVDRWNVTTDQTVTFYLYNTGTAGLGGPTTLSAAINRSSIPQSPNPPSINSIGGTTASYTISARDTGGLPITARQISYGQTTAANSASETVDVGGTLTGLARGSRYYAKARVRNSKGWSGWSSLTVFVTKDVPQAPSPSTITNVTQTGFTAKFNAATDDGGSPIIEHQLGIGYDTSGPTIFFTNGTSYNVINMPPGSSFHVWSRSRNAIGWSAWSQRRGVVLRASAKVVVFGNIWVNSVVYVRQNGTWKLAKPYVKIHGLWQETE